MEVDIVTVLLLIVAGALLTSVVLIKVIRSTETSTNATVVENINPVFSEIETSEYTNIGSLPIVDFGKPLSGIPQLITIDVSPLMSNYGINDVTIKIADQSSNIIVSKTIPKSQIPANGKVSLEVVFPKGGEYTILADILTDSFSLTNYEIGKVTVEDFIRTQLQPASSTNEKALYVYYGEGQEELKDRLLGFLYTLQSRGYTVSADAVNEVVNIVTRGIIPSRLDQTFGEITEIKVDVTSMKYDNGLVEITLKPEITAITDLPSYTVEPVIVNVNGSNVVASLKLTPDSFRRTQVTYSGKVRFKVLVNEDLKHIFDGVNVKNYGESPIKSINVQGDGTIKIVFEPVVGDTIKITLDASLIGGTFVTSDGAIVNINTFQSIQPATKTVVLADISELTSPSVPLYEHVVVPAISDKETIKSGIITVLTSSPYGMNQSIATEVANRILQSYPLSYGVKVNVNPDVNIYDYFDGKFGLLATARIDYNYLEIEATVFLNGKFISVKTPDKTLYIPTSINKVSNVDVVTRQKTRTYQFNFDITTLSGYVKVNNTEIFTSNGNTFSISSPAFLSLINKTKGIMFSANGNDIITVSLNFPKEVIDALIKQKLDNDTWIMFGNSKVSKLTGYTIDYNTDQISTSISGTINQVKEQLFFNPDQLFISNVGTDLLIVPNKLGYVDTPYISSYNYTVTKITDFATPIIKISSVPYVLKAVFIQFSDDKYFENTKVWEVFRTLEEYIIPVNELMSTKYTIMISYGNYVETIGKYELIIQRTDTGGVIIFPNLTVLSDDVKLWLDQRGIHIIIKKLKEDSGVLIVKKNNVIVSSMHPVVATPIILYTTWQPQNVFAKSTVRFNAINLISGENVNSHIKEVFDNESLILTVSNGISSYLNNYFQMLDVPDKYLMSSVKQSEPFKLTNNTYASAEENEQGIGVSLKDGKAELLELKTVYRQGVVISLKSQDSRFGVYGMLYTGKLNAQSSVDMSNSEGLEQKFGKYETSWGELVTLPIKSKLLVDDGYVDIHPKFVDVVLSNNYNAYIVEATISQDTVGTIVKGSKVQFSVPTIPEGDYTITISVHGSALGTITISNVHIKPNEAVLDEGFVFVGYRGIVSGILSDGKPYVDESYIVEEIDGTYTFIKTHFNNQQVILNLDTNIVDGKIVQKNVVIMEIEPIGNSYYIYVPVEDIDEYSPSYAIMYAKFFGNMSVDYLKDAVSSVSVEYVFNTKINFKETFSVNDDIIKIVKFYSTSQTLTGLFIPIIPHMTYYSPDNDMIGVTPYVKITINYKDGRKDVKTINILHVVSNVKVASNIAFVSKPYMPVITTDIYGKTSLNLKELDIGTHTSTVIKGVKYMFFSENFEVLKLKRADIFITYDLYNINNFKQVVKNEILTNNYISGENSTLTNAVFVIKLNDQHFYVPVFVDLTLPTIPFSVKPKTSIDVDTVINNYIDYIPAKTINLKAVDNTLDPLKVYAFKLPSGEKFVVIIKETGQGKEIIWKSKVEHDIEVTIRQGNYKVVILLYGISDKEIKFVGYKVEMTRQE